MKEVRATTTVGNVPESTRTRFALQRDQDVDPYRRFSLGQNDPMDQRTESPRKSQQIFIKSVWQS